MSTNQPKCVSSLHITYTFKCTNKMKPDCTLILTAQVIFDCLSTPSPYCQCAPVSSAVSCPRGMTLPVRWGPRRTWQLCRFDGSRPPRSGERSLRCCPPRWWPFAADPLWVRRRGWQGLDRRASPVPVRRRGLWGPLRAEVALPLNADEGPSQSGWTPIPERSSSLRSKDRICDE